MIRRAWLLLTWRPAPWVLFDVTDVTPHPETNTTTVAWSLQVVFPRRRGYFIRTPTRGWDET